jgi:hypothetical protein
MNWTTWLSIFFVLVLIGWYLSNLAGRLDRLHLKAEAARLSLDTQLAHRTSAIGRLIENLSKEQLAQNNLEQTWRKAFSSESAEITPLDQWQLEGDLTKSLIKLFQQQSDLFSRIELAQVFTDLAAACRRVQYARAFHNDAQKAALAVRQRWVVRWFRLSGRAKLPQPIEFDDQIPPALTNS